MISNWLLILITVVAVGYLGAYIALILFQKKIIYQPTYEIALTPKAANLDYQEIHLHPNDTDTVMGWYVPCINPCFGTLVFFHGNAGNMGDRIDSTALFHELGFNVLLIDYRGFGQSTGHPSEANSYEDGECALRYLIDTHGLKYEDMVLLGRSLGGGIATELAIRHPIRALMLESTYTSIPEVAQDVYPLFPIKYFVTTKYNNLAKLPKVQCPILIVHSQEDQYIPYHHGLKLFDCATPNPNKHMITIHGAHADGFLTSKEVYVEGLKRFFQSL